MFSLFNAKLDRQVQAVTSTSQEPEYLNGTSQDNEHLGSLSSSVQADATVGDLARQLTLCSVQPPYAGVREEDTLFHPKKESDLDPYSSNFSSKAWARKIVDIASRDANKTLRKAGIAYRNLSVHGFGSDTDFQATVTNVFISGMRMLEDAVRSKKNGKVQILSGLDGLVESGEMLIVLGPPGR
jgi:ATP-binding cassette subfamily G (WHITE) protein 2 (PDR)